MSSPNKILNSLSGKLLRLTRSAWWRFGRVILFLPLLLVQAGSIMFYILLACTILMVALLYVVNFYAHRIEARCHEIRELAIKHGKSRKEMFEREVFLNSIVENIPALIFVKSADDLKFVRFNKAAESLLGYSREEMIGKSDYDLFTKSEADFFTQKDRLVLAQRRTFVICEEPIHTRTFGKRVLRTKKVPIYDHNGNPKYLLGISEDITDQKHTESERDRASEEVMRLKVEGEMRNTFVTALSHDLRTPLTVAKTNAELLLHFPERENHRKVLPKMIIKSLDCADKMIRDLLDASRIQAGKTLPLTIEALDLSSFLRELSEQLSLIYGNRFVSETPSALPGYWSCEALRRILENLISNAVKYGASDEPILIQARLDAGQVLISVHNEGKALASDELKTLFQPYTRAAGSESARQGGWGLGLTIVRGLVNALGGTVDVKSSPSTGTTFSVRLPQDARPYQVLEVGRAA